MNNKGFAVSGIIYGILVLFIILLIALLSMFNSRKTVLDELKDKVLNEVGSNVEIKDFTYTKNNITEEYKVLIKGYYKIELKNINGSILSTNIYLRDGEKLYFKMSGSKVGIYSDKTTTLPIVILDNTSYNVNETFNDKYFLNTSFKENTGNTINSINVKYTETIRKNKDLNQVRYIKDCISKNNVDDTNMWSEIRAIVKGENVALNKEIKIYDEKNNQIESDINFITDGNINTFQSEGYCIIVDLGRTYNIDYLYSYHDIDTNKKYYDYNLSVSSANIEYKPVYLYEDNNVIVSAFENSKTKLVDKIYVPVKIFDGATWLRIYHFNNLNGTVYWDAQAQVLSANGYNTIHKKSLLNYLNKFLLNNKYELLLEYPEYASNKYIRWTQTSDFTKLNTISGYKLVKNTFNTSNFNGLKLSGTTNALVTTGDNKHYEIGSYNNGLTGVYGFNDELIGSSVDLWVRIQ